MGTQLGHRLNRAIVAELAVLRLDRLPDRLPRNMQPPRDLLHRLPLHEICTPDPSNRLHRRHLSPHRPPQSQATIDDPGVVPYCTPIPVPVCAPIDSEDATMALMLAHRQAPDWPAELWRDDSKVCSIKRKLVNHSEIWIIAG